MGWASWTVASDTLKDCKGTVREGINDMECFGCCRRFEVRDGLRGLAVWYVEQSRPCFFLVSPAILPVRSPRYLAAL